MVDILDDDEPVLALKDEEDKDTKKKSWQKQAKKQKNVQKKKKVVQKKKSKSEENKENENAGNQASFLFFIELFEGCFYVNEISLFANLVNNYTVLLLLTFPHKIQR